MLRSITQAYGFGAARLETCPADSAYDLRQDNLCEPHEPAGEPLSAAQDAWQMIPFALVDPRNSIHASAAARGLITHDFGQAGPNDKALFSRGHTAWLALAHYSQQRLQHKLPDEQEWVRKLARMEAPLRPVTSDEFERLAVQSAHEQSSATRLESFTMTHRGDASLVDVDRFFRGDSNSVSETAVQDLLAAFVHPDCRKMLETLVRVMDSGPLWAERELRSLARQVHEHVVRPAELQAMECLGARLLPHLARGDMTGLIRAAMRTHGATMPGELLLPANDGKQDKASDREMQAGALLDLVARILAGEDPLPADATRLLRVLGPDAKRTLAHATLIGEPTARKRLAVAHAVLASNDEVRQTLGAGCGRDLATDPGLRLRLAPWREETLQPESSTSERSLAMRVKRQDDAGIDGTVRTQASDCKARLANLGVRDELPATTQKRLQADTPLLNLRPFDGMSYAHVREEVVRAYRAELLRGEQTRDADAGARVRISPEAFAQLRRVQLLEGNRAGIEAYIQLLVNAANQVIAGERPMSREANHLQDVLGPDAAQVLHSALVEGSAAAIARLPVDLHYLHLKDNLRRALEGLSSQPELPQADNGPATPSEPAWTKLVDRQAREVLELQRQLAELGRPVPGKPRPTAQDIKRTLMELLGRSAEGSPPSTTPSSNELSEAEILRLKQLIRNH